MYDAFSVHTELTLTFICLTKNNFHPPNFKISKGCITDLKCLIEIQILCLLLKEFQLTLDSQTYTCIYRVPYYPI